MTYFPRAGVETDGGAEPVRPTARRLYGRNTVPLPVRTDPRTRLVEGLLGLTAGGLFAVSIPLAVVLLAGALGMTIDELLRAPGVSLRVTLWIFLGIALTAAALYSALLVLRKKAEAGAAWITFGIVAGSLCGLFAALANLAGAWAGVAGSALIFGSGLFDTVLALRSK